MRRHLAWILLALFLLLWTAQQLAWTAANGDRHFPGAPEHLALAADHRALSGLALRDAPSVAVAVEQLLGQLSAGYTFSPFWPRAVHLVSATGSLLFGAGPQHPLHANLLWAMLLALGVGLAAIRLRSRDIAPDESALLAIALVFSLPGVVGPFHAFGLDAPLGAAVIFCVALLLRTDGFSHRGWSVAFGVALGAGVHVKGQLLLWLGAPLAVAALSGLRRRRWRNLFVAALLSGAIALLWLGGAMEYLLYSLGRHFLEDYFPELYQTPTMVAERPSAPPLSWGWFAWYRPYLQAYLGPAGVLALGIGGALQFRRGAQPALDRHVLWAAALGGVLVFSLLTGKSERYLLPAFPLLGLLAAVGAMQWGPRLRRCIVGAVVVASMALSLTQSWSPRPDETPAWQRVLSLHRSRNFLRPPRPSRTEGMAELIAEQAQRRSPRAAPAIALLAFPQSPRWHQHQFYEELWPLAYEVQLGLGCVGRDLHPQVDRRLLAGACPMTLLDEVGRTGTLEPGGWFDESQLLVAVHYTQHRADPSTAEWLVPLVRAESEAELSAALPEGFVSLGQRRFGDRVVYFYWRAQPPLRAWQAR